MLTDLQGTVVGEITNASNRQVVLPLNRVPTATFIINADHYLAPYFQDPTWDGMVKCYRSNSLRFIGPLVSGNEAFDGNSQTISVNAAGALWRLSYRLAGKSTMGFTRGDNSTTYDLGTVAQLMLSNANAEYFTGISNGGTAASINGNYGTVYYKDLLTALAELSSSQGSFDFEAAPTEPTNVGQPLPQIALLNISPLLGSVKPNAIFQYGGGGDNVISYTRQIDRSQLCNLGYIQQPAKSDYSGVLTSTDATSIAARGRYEALVDNGGVEWDVLRQALVDLNVSIRKQARQVVQFNPAPDSNIQPFNDYAVGDQVRARIVGPLSNTILDGLMRVWGITFSIDDNDNEEVSLELIHP